MTPKQYAFQVNVLLKDIITSCESRSEISDNSSGELWVLYKS